MSRVKSVYKGAVQLAANDPALLQQKLKELKPATHAQAELRQIRAPPPSGSDRPGTSRRPVADTCDPGKHPFSFPCLQRQTQSDPPSRPASPRAGTEIANSGPAHMTGVQRDGSAQSLESACLQLNVETNCKASLTVAMEIAEPRSLISSASKTDVVHSKRRNLPPAPPSTPVRKKSIPLPLIIEDSTYPLAHNWRLVADLSDFVSKYPHTLPEHSLKLLISHLGLDLNLFMPPPTSDRPKSPVRVDVVFLTVLQSWAAVERHRATFGRLAEELEKRDLNELSHVCKSFLDEGCYCTTLISPRPESRYYSMAESIDHDEPDVWMPVQASRETTDSGNCSS